MLNLDDPVSIESRLISLLRSVRLDHDARAICVADEDGLLVAGSGFVDSLESLAAAGAWPLEARLPKWADPELGGGWLHRRPFRTKDRPFMIVSAGGCPIGDEAARSIASALEDQYGPLLMVEH